MVTQDGTEPTEAVDDTEAARRFASCEHVDPLPEVAPALLNSTDIFRYVLATGMVYPFSTDESALRNKLKSASYEVDLLVTFTFRRTVRNNTLRSIAERDSG